MSKSREQIFRDMVEKDWGDALVIPEPRTRVLQMPAELGPSLLRQRHAIHQTYIYIYIYIISIAISYLEV